jgi:hypothetical protein
MSKTRETQGLKPFESYEKVAQYLIGELAEHFGLEDVEGKQHVAGKSGTSWEIDAKGVARGKEGFVIIECRRQPKSRIKQKAIGELVYSIKDTGAKGGIIVCPLPLQKGARILAEYEKIKHVQLDENSTNTDYVLKFLNIIFAGVSFVAETKSIFSAEVLRDGKVIDSATGE